MYLGDVAAGVTLTHRFYTEDPTGAPITLAGTPSAQVRKGTGSGTVITAGVSLTVDVVTGQHCVDVDLSASGSYAVANDYAIELAAGTVSGISVVGKVLATFSIANRTTLSAAGVRTAVGLASANLDTQLDALPTNAELATSQAAADDATLAALAALTIPTTAQIADKVLGRSLATGSDGGRTVQDALRFSRNKVIIVPIDATSGTLTVYAEDDTTVAWTGVVTRASADALSAVDPA